MQVDNQVIVLERVPYLGALEVCSRQGAIQIHIYLYLYLTCRYVLLTRALCIMFLTERHPDSKANPRRRRQRHHQEDVDEYGSEWNPRYERRAEVKFRRVPRLADE